MLLLFRRRSFLSCLQVYYQSKISAVKYKCVDILVYGYHFIDYLYEREYVYGLVVNKYATKNQISWLYDL